MLKLDILAIGVHPDDVELGCGGTLLRHVKMGRKVGILDLTRGELGTRGSADQRDQEAADAAKILGVEIRLNATLKDGFFTNTAGEKLQVIRFIRHLRPDIVLANAIHDRHPDHGRSSVLASESCFLSGLRKIETEYEGKIQEAWRPRTVYHYLQDRYVKPDFVVDITDHIEQKMEAVRAFRSQFHDPDSKEPETYISSPEFFESLYARSREMGKNAGFRYGEGFTVERTPGISDLSFLI